MVDTAHKIVSYLLELNVLNIQHIERELRNIAVRAIYPQANKWIMTVARNYIVNLEGQEMDSEYQKYTPKRPKKGIHTDMPEPGELPDWAQKAVGGGQAIHFFDPAQPRQRSLWQSVENILDWFNTWRADDPSLNRLDRVSFPKARELATAWRNEIESNPWLHIKDRPPVYKTYPDGMKWVKMHDVHLKREGELMGHCIGGGGYSNRGGTREYYSLRDEKNEPHISVEVSVNGDQRSVIQMKGKGNAKPVARYQSYLRDLVTQPGWTVTGDRGYLDPAPIGR